MPLIHILIAIGINAVWGFSFVAAKIGVEALPPLWFTALRFSLVLTALGYLVRIRHRKRAQLIAIALTSGPIFFALLYMGIKLADQVSTVAIAMQLVLPFSVVLAAILLKEPVGWRQALAIALATSGVITIGFDPRVLHHIDGLALVVLAALSVSLSIVLMRRLEGVSVFEVQAWIALAGAPVLLALSLCVETGQVMATLSTNWSTFGALIFAAFGVSVLAQGGQFYLLQRHPVSSVLPYSLLAPVFGVIFGILLFGDRMSVRFIAGAIMTMTGVTVITLLSRSRAV